MSSRMSARALVGCVRLPTPADCWLVLRSRRRTPPRERFNQRSDPDCVAACMGRHALSCRLATILPSLGGLQTLRGSRPPVRRGWSLDPTDWDHFRAEVGTLEWHRIAFDSVFRDSVADLPGVYAICAQSSPARTDGIASAFYNALYVGQTRQRGGLRQRFLQHLVSQNQQLQLAKSCFPKTEFWWAHASPDRLNQLEAVLMNALGPPVNKFRAPLVGVLQPPRPA